MYGETGAVAVAFWVGVPILGLILKAFTFDDEYVSVALCPRRIAEGEIASVHIGCWMTVSDAGVVY